MERKGLFKLPYHILLYDIPNYLELKDYINYISTCKFLRDNYEKSDIWKRELNKKYNEEEILFAQDKNSSFEKFKKLATQTINYNNCEVAHRKTETYWQEKENELSLINVCWLHIIGKLENVPDGRYVPEFKIKIKRRFIGLGRLQFRATVLEKEIESKDEENEENNSQEQEQTTQPRDGNEQPTEGSDLNQREVMMTENIFNRNTLNLYKNEEWRIVECPEIQIDRSSIDPCKSKIIVELEIKDINGYWKSGLSFKGMRLRNVVPSDSDTDISDNEN